MPKKSRAAREQLSSGQSPSTNAPMTGSMAWAAQEASWNFKGVEPGNQKGPG